MSETIVEMEFKAVTPLWPGGPLGGATYKCFGNRCIGPFLPDEKQLIGRIRWLLRTVEASVRLLEGKPVRSYREVDGLASRIFGSTSAASKVVVRLKYSLPSRNEDLEYFNFRNVRHSPPRLECNIIEVMEVEGYWLLRRRLSLNFNPRNSLQQARARKIFKCYGKALNWLNNNKNSLENLYLLLTIPRVRLAFQGANNLDEVYPKTPLRPILNVRIEVLKRTGVSLSKAEARLLTVAIPYTMSFLGLGKATSRGFGRFKLEKTGLRSDVNRVDDCLEKLASLSPENLKETFVECGCTMVDTAAEILGSRVFCGHEILKKYGLGVVIEENNVVTVKDGADMLGRLQGTRVPALVTALALADKYFIRNMRHPCPYATPELTARSLTGCLNNKHAVKGIVEALSAVGKATLKSVWKLKHGSVRSPGPGYHTWTLGLPRSVSAGRFISGYYSIGSRSLGEHCSSDPPKLEELRRLSPVVITVLCENGACSGLLEAFISVSDFEERLEKIVHVGRHGPIYHVANVKYILSNKSLGTAHSCPKDHAGMATPNNRPGTSVVGEDAALASQLVALEWVKTLLS